jgi:hypothetical protein
MSTFVITAQTPEDAQRAYARLAGLMYFVVLVFDIVGAVIPSAVAGSGDFVATSHRIVASETLYRVGLCCSLVGSLATILLAVGLYVAVKPADGNLALTALLFRLAESAIGGMGIILAFTVLQMHVAANHATVFDANQLGALADLYSHGGATEISAIFFSVGSTLFFFVFLRSHYIPRILAAWGIFASLVYAAVWFVSLILPQDSATAAAYGSAPILIAELSTGLWLLIRGINVQTGK